MVSCGLAVCQSAFSLKALESALGLISLKAGAVGTEGCLIFGADHAASKREAAHQDNAASYVSSGEACLHCITAGCVAMFTRWPSASESEGERMTLSVGERPLATSTLFPLSLPMMMDCRCTRPSRTTPTCRP